MVQARGYGIRVSAHRVDVADRVAVAEFPGIVAAEHGGVDVLVNNAGVAVGGTFEQVCEEDFEWLFEINFWGVVRMTRVSAVTASERRCASGEPLERIRFDSAAGTGGVCSE